MLFCTGFVIKNGLHLKRGAELANMHHIVLDFAILNFERFKSENHYKNIPELHLIRYFFFKISCNSFKLYLKDC